MQHRVLVYLYVGALAVTALVFVVQGIRWGRSLKAVPETGESLDYRFWPPPLLRGAVGMLAVLLVAPFLYFLIRRPNADTLHNPAIALVGLFLAIGLGLLASSLVAAKRRSRRGRLLLDTPRPAAGLTLRGRYELPYAAATDKPIRVHLVLQKVRLVRRGRSSSITEEVVWKASDDVHPQHSSVTTIIPFVFDVPSTLPPSTEWQGGERHEWILVFEGKAVGGRRKVAVRMAPPTEHVAEVDDLASDRPTGTEPPLRPGAAAGSAGQSPWLSLLGSAFVVVFALVMWFAIAGKGRPWLDLKHTLPPLLAKGAVVLAVFGLPVLAIRKALLSRKADAPADRRNVLKFVLAADAVLMVGVGYLVYVYATGGHRMNEMFDKLESAAQWFAQGVLGVFVILGAVGVVLSLASVLRGRST